MAEFRIQRRDSSNGMTDIKFVPSSATSITFSAVTADSFYGDGSNLSGVTDTFITGFTYDGANTFTISRNDVLSLNTSINAVTGLTVTNYIDYTTSLVPNAISGRTYFDRNENALSYFPNTNNNDVTINIGQESVIRVYNGTGQQINNGQACHITSEAPSVNGIPQVLLAIATGSTTTGSKYLVSGIATHDIPNGEVGFITAFGVVRDLTITGVTEGNEVYLSDTTPGGLIFTPPSNISSRRSQIGYVRTTGVTTAEILVEIENEVGFADISNTELSIIAENSFSTGIRVGGEMSINGGDNTLVDISAGSGVIVDNYTDPLSPVVTNVSWDTITGVSLTYLTANTGSYLFIESDGVTIRQIPNTSPPSEADFRDYLFLGLIGHASNLFINNVFNAPTQLVSPVNQHVDLTSAIGPFSISGNRLSTIPDSLELEKSAGRSFFYGGNFHTDPKTPSQINTGILSGSTLIYAKGDKILGPSGTTVDTDNYDPNGLGVITSIPGNNYTTHRIWHSPKNNLLIFQYGQYVYANQATARDEIDNETYVVPQGLDFAAYLIAVLIVKGAEPDLNEALIVPQGKFSGTGGGGGGSVDTLQTAYNNSTSPEIITDTTRNAVDFRIGTGTDSDDLVTFQQTDGTINAWVNGLGDSSFNSVLSNTFSGGTFYGDGSNLSGISSTDFYVTGGTYNNGNLTLDRQNGSVNISGFFTGFTLDAPNGSPQNVTNGQSILFNTSSGLTASIEGTRSVVYRLDINNTPSEPSPTTGDKLLVYDATSGEHRNIDWNQLPGAGGGEVNTASNVGVGYGIFKQKTGVDLEFRSLSAGTNVTITTGDTIVISSTGGGSSRIKSSVTTTGSTPTELEKIDTLTDNATNIIEVFVKAYESGAAEYGVWKRTLTVTKVSGTVTIREENADVDKTSSGLNANSVSFSVNGGDIDLDVTGINATTIDWESAYEIIL